MDRTGTEIEGRVGDWIEAPRRDGAGTRIGQIVEVLGWPGREHYQVRWDEHHETMVFPGEDVRIVRRPRG